MISRRQLLRASLTVCGCAMCNELGISTFADSARADSPTAIKGTGYDLWFIGGQRETVAQTESENGISVDLLRCQDLLQCSTPQHR